MTSFIRNVITLFMMLMTQTLYASDNIINVYTWAEEIPTFIIDQFEKETGIHVNYSTYDSNEIMYAKLRASKHPAYDIVEPSSYYVDRMRRQNLLEPLNKSYLPNFKYLDPEFTNLAYDPQSQYSIPFVWGITGIFVNQTYFKDVKNWNQFTEQQYANQLMFLDDSREVFAMALHSMGYSINDSNPEHIRQAYLKLKELLPNIRLFNSDAVASILIDEDATVGMAWNGDLYKAMQENPHLQFIFPKDGFEIWVDNFAILKTAPHKENAYKFLNFLMRPDIAKAVSLAINYSTANLAAKELMPVAVKNNPVLYPPHHIFHRGECQVDIGDQAFALYETYWEQLKMGA